MTSPGNSFNKYILILISQHFYLYIVCQAASNV